MRRLKKKGGLMKLLIPVVAFLAGVMFGDTVKPMLSKIPILGGLLNKGEQIVEKQ